MWFRNGMLAHRLKVVEDEELKLRDQIKELEYELKQISKSNISKNEEMDK